MSGVDPALMRRTNHLRTSDEFSFVYRNGRRARTESVVAVVAKAEAGNVKVGFATSKKTGNAVRRNRARRRLRAAVEPFVETLAGGTLLVLQSTPATAEVEFQKLVGDMRTALNDAGALHA